MTRKAAVTQDAVNAACEQLQEAGKNVTVNAVIAIAGGSFSTVGSKVAHWKEEQEAKAVPVIEMPETVTQAMQRATTEIWGAASALAGEAIERIQGEAGETIGKAKEELAEYAGEVARLENELAAAQEKAAAIDTQLVKTAADLSQANNQNTALETRLADRDSELERLRGDYDKLQAELIEIAKTKAKIEDKTEDKKPKK